MTQECPSPLSYTSASSPPTRPALSPRHHCCAGSCWAFSTTGSIEGAYQIASGTLVSLSEEELVQCDRVSDNGCEGGLMDNAFEWIEKNGIALESTYPYTSGGGQTGSCDKSKAIPAVTISSFKDVPKGDEDALKSAVALGPVSIAIEADKSAFQLYKSGVLDSPSCGKKLDHGVLAVGYGSDSDSGKDFWKVKNSWGATWGEQGFIRMVRGSNMCGIASQASYPTGAKAASPSPPSPGPSPPSPSIALTQVYFSPVFWSTTLAWRWLKVPRSTSWPVSRTLCCSSNSDPIASASPVAQSMPSPLSNICAFCFESFFRFRCRLKLSGQV